MRVDVDGVSYTAHFKHSKRRVRPFTACLLHVGLCSASPCAEDGSQWTGLARCAPTDQFVKAVGRKLALARAMQAAQLPKPTRAAIWAAYHARGEFEKWPRAAQGPVEKREEGGEAR